MVRPFYFSIAIRLFIVYKIFVLHHIIQHIYCFIQVAIGAKSLHPLPITDSLIRIACVAGGILGQCLHIHLGWQFAQCFCLFYSRSYFLLFRLVFLLIQRVYLIV